MPAYTARTKASAKVGIFVATVCRCMYMWCSDYYSTDIHEKNQKSCLLETANTRHTHTCTYQYVPKYIHRCINTSVRTCIHVYTQAHTHTHMYKNTCTQTYIHQGQRCHSYTFTDALLQAYVRVCMYTHKHAHTHTYLHQGRRCHSERQASQKEETAIV
jgi:hypothetical protein